MALFEPDLPTKAQSPPRAVGNLVLSSKRIGAASAIDTLRSAGALKALFPRGPSLQAVLINTAGGVTGGDRFAIDAAAGPGSRAVLTTQAAERAYRATSGTATLDTRLHVDTDASLCWLPQELIVFDGASLTRRLRADLADTARLLVVEPLVFGRAAMGERLIRIALDDRIEIRRDGVPLYLDRTRMVGDGERLLSQSAVARDARAMASAVLVAPDADTKLDRVRALLPPTGGATLLAADVLVVRVLARDGFLLRRSLVPILEILKGSTLPRSWSL